ncbi:hypothetical protein GQ53DRAFT_817044 [Thozetella sp. PMI_491]|nr:hypothetical protein GQ53DRAFT_817044 [Thozetella sp. PMI_491]
MGTFANLQVLQSPSLPSDYPISTNFAMARTPCDSPKWAFTRPDPLGSRSQYFRADLRQIAGLQPDLNLPWEDNMYLAYPSPEAPDWSTFIAHVKQLNAEADVNTQYKILYIMRRAHKTKESVDPGLDELGIKQSARLAAKFERAMQTAGLPSPEVIVTSPLARALETTQLGIAPLFPSIRPRVLEGLREGMTGNGKNERHSKAWIEQNFAGFDAETVSKDDHITATYGDADSQEPYETIWQRVQDALGDVFETSSDALVVLLMAHCHVEQTIQREITGWDLPEAERKETVEFFVGEAEGYAMIVKGVRGCD